MIENIFPQFSQLKVVVLAGGVGGAKLVLGLDRVLPIGNLAAIVNTGDDFIHFGLKICPDIDSVTYALAGLSNKSYGWGLEDETWNVANALEAIGAPTWFQLGDRDLATHLERTRLLVQGKKLSEVTADLCARWGIASRILPMSDDDAPTLIETKTGTILPFQDYLVREKAQPEVNRILLHGGVEPKLLPEALLAIQQADLVVIAPSNPWVSIDPILALESMREALQEKYLVAVSPIIQGKAVMDHYADLLDLFIYDASEKACSPYDVPNGIETRQMQTIMTDEADKIQLASEILEYFIEQGAGK